MKGESVWGLFFVKKRKVFFKAKKIEIFWEKLIFFLSLKTTFLEFTKHGKVLKVASWKVVSWNKQSLNVMTYLVSHRTSQ